MKDMAISVLQRLTNGVHPVTGEIFAADSPYNDPVVIRSLLFVLEQMQPPSQPERPENHGRAWTRDETEFAVVAYKEGAALIHIAKTLKRTRGSIRSELVKRGIIPEAETIFAPGAGGD